MGHRSSLSNISKCPVVALATWIAQMYKREIEANMASLYKKPGYGPF